MSEPQTAIALDLGGTKIAGSVIDDRGHIVKSVRLGTPETTDDVVAAVIGIVEEFVESAPDGAMLAGVGLAVAGTIDSMRGVIVQSPNLPFENLALKEIIERDFSLPTFLDNDGNLATLGECRFGAAKNMRNVVGLTLGTGIGAGIVIDGSIYRGETGSAGELGHMVIDARGPRCTCGSFGCYEEMAAGRALVRIAKERAAVNNESLILAFASGNVDKITGTMVTEAARAGDAAAIDCFKEVGYWLGIGLNNIVNMFNPEIIVIGGGMAEAGEFVLEPAIRVVERQSLRPNRDVVSIVKAELGNRAGLFGAAALVFDGLL